MKHANRWIIAALLVVSFSLPYAVGYYYTAIMGYMHSDAMSRVANAFYVLFSRDPHLGAIGFIWNPLPSVINLFFLIFYPLFPGLATAGLAGVWMSCSFTAFTCVYLFTSSLNFGLNRLTGVMISLLFLLNPIFFYFGFTGLSDAPFNFFLIYTVVEFLLWRVAQEPGRLIKSSFGLAMAFWTRYEAVPFGVAMAVCMVMVIWFIRHHQNMKNESRLHRLYEYEGTAILYLTPVVFSGLLWIWFNYLIMDNPLYFLNSEYSNQAQMATFDGSEAAMYLKQSALNGLWVVLQKSSYFLVLTAFILLYRLLSRRIHHYDMLMLLLMVFSIPALQYLLVLQQSSFVWFRYFSYILPITVAWVPYEISQAKNRKLYAPAIMAAMVISGLVMGYAISDPTIAPDEHTTVTRGIHQETQTRDRAVAEYLDEHYADVDIMVDSYSAYLIIVSSTYPTRFLITSDLAFDDAIAEPWNYGVEYVLLPRPRPGAPMSVLNTVYPNFFDKGAEFATLAEDFDGEWRLYKLNQ
jgi:hypothetical protein